MKAIDVEFLDYLDDRAAVAEAKLDAIEFPLPLTSRVSWNQHLGSKQSKLVIACGANGEPVAGVGLELRWIRSAPGFFSAIVHALGEPYANAEGAILLQEIVRFAQLHGRILRMTVELECRTDATREFLRNGLEALGLQRVPTRRIPERTLALDLGRPVEEILAGFPGPTRYNLRKAERLGVEVVPIVDSGYGPRMNALLADTFARTGTSVSASDWGAIIALCRDVPHRSRLVGVFVGPDREPERLLAYGWSVHHGDRAAYHTSASTKSPDVKAPLMYPALWELIKWAKEQGANWFDFGGVTAGTGSSQDPLGRISDFKRSLCRNEINFGEEWVYEPRGIGVAIPRNISDLVRRIRNFRHQAP